MGLIHRDIKPSNILLEDGVDHVKIADFGLARAADDASITQSGLIAGTPMYMAPEQALGESIDQRADLFSLGSVLYVMCTGRPPFQAANALAVLKRVVGGYAPPDPGDRPGGPGVAVRPDRPAARQEPGRSVRLGAGGGRPARATPGRAATSRERPGGAQIDMPSEFVEKPATIRRRNVRNRGWAAASAVLLMSFGALGFTEATGVTDFHGTVVRLFTPAGTLVIEVDDPEVSVKIDGADIVITGTGAREIRLRPGTYAVEASKDGKLVRQELVTVTRNERQVVRVSREAPPVTKAATRSAEESAWERVVAALSAPEQIRAVERTFEGAQSRLRRRRRAHYREWRGEGAEVQHR